MAGRYCLGRAASLWSVGGWQCHSLLAGLSQWGNDVRHWFHFGCYKVESYGAMELIQPCPTHAICAKITDLKKVRYPAVNPVGWLLLLLLWVVLHSVLTMLGSDRDRCPSASGPSRTRTPRRLSRRAQPKSASNAAGRCTIVRVGSTGGEPARARQPGEQQWRKREESTLRADPVVVGS